MAATSEPAVVSSEVGRAEAACVVAAVETALGLVANSEPMALSKKPGDEGRLEAGLGAAVVGAAELLANCDPTLLSKKPFEPPATHRKV